MAREGRKGGGEADGRMKKENEEEESEEALPWSVVRFDPTKPIDACAGTAQQCRTLYNRNVPLFSQLTLSLRRFHCLARDDR